MTPFALAGVLTVLTGVGEIPPFDSGLIATYVEITAEQDDNVEVFFLPYMDRKQRVPSVGQHCEINYKVGEINGLVGREAVLLHDAKIIKTIDCD